MNEIKILELFGGIGAIRKAFERQNIPHKVVDYVEIDKYAVASYNSMFNENFEVQDICNWDKDIKIDFIMHGSPCQDFSVAGLGQGGDEGTGTRSSLMWETVRIIKKLKPKYVLWENVKNVIGKKHKHNFDKYINTLNELGYTSYCQVLNAKNYGIPQNRERVFTLSIRNDIDDVFLFPQKEELKLQLKDMLENEVDEKYYISEKRKNLLLSDTKNWVISEKKYEINRSIARTINTRQGSTRTDESEYICDTLPANFNILKIKNNTKQGYLVAEDGDSVYIEPSKTKRGTVQKGIAQTITQQRQNMGVVVSEPKPIERFKN